MTTGKNRYNHGLNNMLGLLIVFILFQSCKVYQNPTTLEQASNSNEKSYLKITMLNGDEYIYEDLEMIAGKYYGINTKNNEKITTLLDKDEIKIVQKQNKKASGFINLLGITVGIGSIFLAISMF